MQSETANSGTVARGGLLDGDPGIRPAHHLYVDFKAPWDVIADGLPKYADASRLTVT